MTLLHTTRVCDMEDLAVCVNVESDCTQQVSVTLALWLFVVMLTATVHNKTYTTRQCGTGALWLSVAMLTVTDMYTTLPHSERLSNLTKTS